jgi:hypothetical protein
MCCLNVLLGRLDKNLIHESSSPLEFKIGHFPNMSLDRSHWIILGYLLPVYWRMFSIAQAIRRQMTGDQWIMKWKGRRRLPQSDTWYRTCAKMSWANSIHYPGKCLQVLQEATRALRQAAALRAKILSQDLPKTKSERQSFGVTFAITKLLEWYITHSFYN